VFNMVSGLYPPDSGAVRLRGQPIHRIPTQQFCRRGVARSFQITNLFANLSIYENLRLSVQAQHAAHANPWRDIDAISEIQADTQSLVRFLGLEGIESVLCSDLSYGGQRVVDLGIALGSRPQVLLLDEPLAGLAAAERERVSALVKTISADIPVLIVEHDIDRVLALSHQVTVMNQGELLMSGPPEAVRSNAKVQEVYTGSGNLTVTGRQPEPTATRATVLECKGVNTFYGKSHILNDVSLQIRTGEIVALLGRNGAGKTTMLKTVAGLAPAASGSIQFGGTEVRGLPPHEVARLGIGYVPQGRGLFAGMSVADNLHLGRLARKPEGRDGVTWSEPRILDQFPSLKRRLHTPADYLSGGEQQMLAVARTLSGPVQLLLLDEPFEGLAPAAVEELFVVFDALRKEVPILIVEHNLDLVLALADRVYAMERGAIFHEDEGAKLHADLDYRKKILWL
jgi:ABC-type branched-subunit amino acid transport system ATPase component